MELAAKDDGYEDNSVAGSGQDPESQKKLKGKAEKNNNKAVSEEKNGKE